MKKIGILTFHDADNLGAVLQAYALQKKLCERKVDAEIIDYKCEKIAQTKRSNKKGAKRILFNLYYMIKGHGFNKFRKKYFRLSRKKYFKENTNLLNDDYDSFVVGSDQIWNLGCTDNDYSYFLDFATDSKKKISYAASLGVYRFENNNLVAQEYLNRFDCISVREISAKNELISKFGVESVVMPDPVFLLTQAEWKGIMSRRLCRKKYILVYLIQEDVNVTREAERFALENDVEIVNNKKSISFILHNSPADFISWIYYSEAVFTNSFHGTAFSLIFNKLLAADIELKSGEKNNRVFELLEKADSQECIIDGESGKPNRANFGKALQNECISAADYLDKICE